MRKTDAHGHPFFAGKLFLKFLKKPIDISANHVIIQKLSGTATKYGGIAQLGERLNGIQEVSGSIPLISTRNTAFHYEMRCFSNFLAFFVFLGQQKVNRISRFCPLTAERMVRMAYIQEKVKGKKIVSFKIKACLGRDANGKQLFKCTTWYPPADLTPAKARKEAQKVAGVWEEEVRQNYIKEQEARAVAGEFPAPAPVYTFDAFVNEVCVPLCVRDGSHRPATVAMYTNILKIILPQFQRAPQCLFSFYQKSIVFSYGTSHLEKLGNLR